MKIWFSALALSVFLSSPLSAEESDSCVSVRLASTQFIKNGGSVGQLSSAEFGVVSRFLNETLGLDDPSFRKADRGDITPKPDPLPGRASGGALIAAKSGEKVVFLALIEEGCVSDVRALPIELLGPISHEIERAFFNA